MGKRQWTYTIIGGLVGSYLLRFPLRLLEDWLMGKIEGIIAENFHWIVSLIITWLLPVVVVFGAIWLGYHLKHPKIKMKTNPTENSDRILPVAYPKTGQAQVNTPKIATAELQFPRVICSIEDTNTSQFLIQALLVSTGLMKLEAAELEISGKRIPSIDWRVHELWPSQTTSYGCHFEIPKGLSKGQHDWRLLIYANNMWRTSEWQQYDYAPIKF